ncbi:hypothetical protein Poli38472_007916 [Pythium oligandrum]|uniref:Transmembrane protein n=1 Tax=Pythium oligandrum TaxID=41045 RepID=A0A8K1CKM5_PYTOL|nr:hypothetical protein Poli38472_007916 [Pythium oligandrum]|eukprot:TMW65274.1 hypothetical protein Poli38472_007916 [Pythium oligandrum]
MADNAREETAAQVQADAAAIEVTDVEAETRPQDDVTQSVEDRRKLFTKRGSSINEVFASIRVNSFPPLTGKDPSRELEATEEAEDEDDNSFLLTLGISMVTLPVVFAVLSIIPIFWCLRIDGKVSWSWAVRFGSSWAFTTSPFAVALFITQKLDGDIDWSLVHVLTPYFLYDGLNVVEFVLTVVGGTQSFLATLFSGNNTPFHMIARFVQIILIALRVDGHLGDASWWVVFAPMWISLAVGLITMVVLIVKPQLTSVFFPQVQMQPSLFIIVLGLSWIAIVLPYIVLVARLAGGFFSTFYILLPVSIFMGLSFIGGVGVLVMACFSSDSPAPIASPKHDSSVSELSCLGLHSLSYMYVDYTHVR